MKYSNHITNIIKNLLVISCMIFIVIITISNIAVYIISKAVIYLLPVIAIVIILYIFTGHSKSKAVYFAIEVFVLAFVLRSIFAACFNAPQTSDFEKIYLAAQKVANGDFSFSSDIYFRLWAYQTGIVAYYGGLIKLLGHGITALKIINCLYIAGLNVLIYFIARKLANERCARFVTLLYLFYPATYFYVSVLTNQHISNFLILAGFYIIICRKKFSALSSIFPAGLMALGNAMRPQAVVVLAAITGAILFEIITNIKNKKMNLLLLKSLAVFLIFYFIIAQGLSFAVKETGLNKNGLENTFPLYKFAVGLNDKTHGTYSQEDADALISINDPDIRNKKAQQIIRRRLSSPKSLAKLFIAKQVVMWSVTDYTMEFEFSYLKDTGVHIIGTTLSYDTFIKGFQNLEKNFYILIFILSALGILTGHKQNENSRLVNTIIFNIFLNFAVYSLIEVQPRYRDFQMIFIFISAAAGMDSFEKFKMSVKGKYQFKSDSRSIHNHLRSNLNPLFHKNN